MLITAGDAIFLFFGGVVIGAICASGLWVFFYDRREKSFKKDLEENYKLKQHRVHGRSVKESK